MKLLSTANEKLSSCMAENVESGGVGRERGETCTRMELHQRHVADYDAKSDDFQLKFNNACNMVNSI